VVRKRSLLDWMDKEIVEDFCCYRISLKHSSVYTIFTFKYIRFPFFFIIGGVGLSP
jgi:hypothetical protein